MGKIDISKVIESSTTINIPNFNLLGLTWEDIKTIDQFCVEEYKKALEQGEEIDDREIYTRVLNRFISERSNTPQQVSGDDNHKAWNGGPKNYFNNWWF